MLNNIENYEIGRTQIFTSSKFAIMAHRFKASGSKLEPEKEDRLVIFLPESMDWMKAE